MQMGMKGACKQKKRYREVCGGAFSEGGKISLLTG